MITNKSFPVSDADFRKSIDSKYCGACVTVACKPEGIAVRDSKDPKKTTLFFTKVEWAAFTNGVKRGEFD